MRRVATFSSGVNPSDRSKPDSLGIWTKVSMTTCAERCVQHTYQRQPPKFQWDCARNYVEYRVPLQMQVEWAQSSPKSYGQRNSHINYGYYRRLCLCATATGIFNCLLSILRVQRSQMDANAMLRSELKTLNRIRDSVEKVRIVYFTVNYAACLAGYAMRYSVIRPPFVLNGLLSDIDAFAGEIREMVTTNEVPSMGWFLHDNGPRCAGDRPDWELYF
ncbi:hypothetical protein BKA83DRAFT_4130938 [Pisolithus microcarpus]|nr:hypothetical protein BKA83DRAFT_4130938 [Pisolithus microcarpus]